MKKILSAFLAALIMLTALSGSFGSYAQENEAVIEKTYENYGSYVLLGDSVASGWSDVVHKETRFVRVEGSYGALIADELGVEYHPMACIGFRTTEMRYIFEDDFEGDRFLFYSVDHEEMEWRIPLIRQAVADAGLITLNVGGNDWGSYIGWHVLEEMDKFADKNEEFMQKAEEYLVNAGTEADTIESLIDIASLCGALPDIIKVLPSALKKGFEDFKTNWDYMIEDIYALNPDVTLVVTGMFDNMVRDQETAEENEAALLKLSLGQIIVDYANQPMIEGAEKYGYIYVDTTGTVCEENHPSAEGHRFIADKILEALPDASFPYADVAKNADEYKAIEFMCQNGYMQGLTETKFGYSSSLTKAQLTDMVYNISGKADAVDSSDDAAGYIETVMAAFSAIDDGLSFRQYIKAIVLVINLIADRGIFNLSKDVTRAEAAVIFKEFIDIR